MDPPHPRPTPRSRLGSADGIPVTQLTSNTAFAPTSSLPVVPIPRPRQRNTGSVSSTDSDLNSPRMANHQDSILEEEDIYTDNLPNDSSQASNQIKPPMYANVAWGENPAQRYGIHGNSVEGGPTSSGFVPVTTAHPNQSPTVSRTVAGISAQLRGTNLGPPSVEELSQREQALSQRETDLRRREENFRTVMSDREFELKEKERVVQLREDAVHMREKEVKHKEFDLLNSDATDSLGNTGEKLASLANKEMELEERGRELSDREQHVSDHEISLQQWDRELRQREQVLSQREAYQPQYTQPTQSYTHQHNPGYPRTQGLGPQELGVGYVDGQGFVPQGTQAFQPGQDQGYANVQHQAVSPHNPRAHAYTQPVQGYQYEQQPLYGNSAMMSPQTPTGQDVYTRPPPDIPPTQYPKPSPPPPKQTAPLPSPIVTPVTQAKKTVSMDEELATMLQATAGHHSKQSQIDKDAELARQLMEADERDISTTLDMDTQLALILQQEDLQDNDLTITNELSGSDMPHSASAQEIIQQKLQEEIAQKREREERDRLLAAQLAESDTTTPPRNDLNS